MIPKQRAIGWSVAIPQDHVSRFYFDGPSEIAPPIDHSIIIADINLLACHLPSESNYSSIVELREVSFEEWRFLRDCGLILNDPHLFDVAFDRLNGIVEKLFTLLAPVLIEFDEVISKLLLASFLVVVILDDV